MLVEEVMTKNIVSIECNKTIFNACQEYSKNKVGSLVAMDKKITVGILTERDIIEKVILEKKDPNKTKVREIMSPNIKTVHALAPLEKAAKIMRENQIKKLPVILNNEIVGIITETDLSQTIEAFSEAVEELTKFYANTKENMERMMDKWGDILVSLRSCRQLKDLKDIQTIENEINKDKIEAVTKI
jgi:CBS domain-containing protein